MSVPAGRCRCKATGCRRWLTSADSIALGYGPTCAAKLGLTPAPAVRRLRAAPRGPDPDEPLPGQTEIPLNDQPTLWSP